MVSADSKVWHIDTICSTFSIGSTSAPRGRGTHGVAQWTIAFSVLTAPE
jgi:hypothetical protein